MKKLSLGLLLVAVALLSCKKEELDTNPFNMIAKGDKGTFVIEEEDYPADLISSVDGEVYIQIQSNQSEIVYYSESPIYNFNASVLTGSSTSVDITAGASTNNYVLGTTGAASGYQVYNTLSTGTNPTYLASYFSKNVTVQLNIGIAVTPISNTVDVPEPIMITAPANDPTSTTGSDMTSSATFTWVADPSNKVGVIVRVLDIPSSGLGTTTMLLTPDDGSLSFSDLASYLPSSGRFEIELTRLSYKTFTAGGKNYRLIGATTSIGRYTLI